MAVNDHGIFTGEHQNAIEALDRLVADDNGNRPAWSATEIAEAFVSPHVDEEKVLSLLRFLEERGVMRSAYSPSVQKDLWVLSPRDLKPGTSYDFGNGPVTVHHHPNGGGWVADTAKVDEEAYVGWFASVADNARVEAGSTIAGRATVGGNASLHGGATVRDNGIVLGDATMYEQACVSGNASISGGASLEGRAKVLGNAQVSGGSVKKDAEVTGNAVVKGHAEITDKAVVDEDACVSGHASVRDHAQISGHAIVSDFAVVAGYSAVMGNARIGGDASLKDGTLGGDEVMGVESETGPMIEVPDDELSSVSF